MNHYCTTSIEKNNGCATSRGQRGRVIRSVADIGQRESSHVKSGRFVGMDSHMEEDD